MTKNTEQQAVPVAQQAMYLIRKGGYFYRPNAQGYTSEKAAAGRYTLAEAISYSHPNGANGPRDGIDYILADEPAALALPCKSGEGADHGLGPHATVVDDCEDGFMSVAIVVGENVYLAQGGKQITMSRGQFAQIAKTSIDATQTREAELVAEVERWRHKLWMVACHATGGGIPEIEGIDASVNDICVQISASRNVVYQAGKDAGASAALNARGGA